MPQRFRLGFLKNIHALYSLTWITVKEHLNQASPLDKSALFITMERLDGFHRNDQNVL